MGIVTREDAKQRGLKRYFSGIPCKNGHVDERLVSINMCVSCKKIYKKRWQENHLERYRKENRERSLAWREHNRERHRLKSLEAYWRNPERARERARERWKSDASIREKSKIRHSTPEYRAYSVRKAKEWAVANPEKMRNAIRLWAKRNPEKMAQYRRTRRTRKRNATGSHTVDDIQDILRMQRGRCAYCSVSLSKKKKHVDHIVALSRGGSNDRANLQMLCDMCNFRKNSRDPIEFAQSLGRLI